MSWGEDFMEQARLQVAAGSNFLSQKISTMAWYKGRKAIKHAPITALTNIGKVIPVPVLGTVLDKAIEEALKNIDDARKAKKRDTNRARASRESLESLRKAAKADAKNLKTLADKIESYQVKLKDAAAAVLTALQAYDAACLAGAVTKEQVWKVALAIYERERYEDEILTLADIARTGLVAVVTYASQSRDRTAELEEGFIEELDNRAETFLENVPLLSRTRSGSL